MVEKEGKKIHQITSRCNIDYKHYYYYMYVKEFFPFLFYFFFLGIHSLAYA